MNENRKSLKFSVYLPILVFSLIFLYHSLLFAQSSSGIGKYGASFLQINSSARQVALGGAFTGLADDVNLMRFNVGGLGMLKKTTLGLNYHKWIGDTQQGSMGIAMPLGFAVVGVDIIYFNEGEITELNNNFDPTGAILNSTDVAMSFGGGFRKRILGMEASFGGAAKVIRQNLAEHSATALGMDLGVLLKKGRFSYGASLQNFSITKLKFLEKEFSLPETYRGGIGFNTKLGKNLKINLATDVAWLASQKIRIYSGGEVIIGDIIALRGGYKFHNFEVNRWAAGMGLYIPMKWLNGSKVRIDYSYSPLDLLGGSTHRFSMLFEFRSLGPELGVDQTRISEMTAELQQQLDAAKKARLETEKAEQQAKEVARLMADRLNQVQQIAKESKGKIEVHTQTPTDSVWVTMRINFDFDRANIRPDEFETMHRIGKILNTYPGTKVHISGHTDFIGTEEYNIRLSHRRVDSVMVFLNKKEGVDFDRFYYPIGYGKEKPIADNNTREGRFKNRRVDFVIYTTDNALPVPEGSAIKSVEMRDDSTVQIICNGKVKFEHKFMTNPDRIVIDFPKIFLLSTKATFAFNNDIFLRARVGYHPDEKFSRIVLDLKSPIKYDIATKDNIVYIRAR
ncbi:MAG: PorV/PorQ family protein [Calditrichaeota bacterium]|nr:PorV/PorQ family protein [Calditrichota bacterium]